MPNALRERRRKEMANQYVNLQCELLYHELCGECKKVEISEKEKEEMVRRARKPDNLSTYSNRKTGTDTKKQKNNRGC